ncbi:MAG: hypothetical protein KIT17_08650 [Rubrivivax sp.]|nr:hypothetical protein [Rubrivivax sp.]
MEEEPRRRLLGRLDAIARSVQQRPEALALIALGSVGREPDRLDAWSDLDFFVVVQPGAKARFVEDLSWLAAVRPLVWHFRNTADGHKALMDDGVFCEFAVFTADELAPIPFAPGRLVWQREGVDESIATPQRELPRRPADETWIVGEALACLLVGLARWRRGEKLSAMRLVQGAALDRLIELDALRTRPPAGDPFNAERRLETRQPALAAELPRLAPGYEHTPAAAGALLAALRARGAVLNAAVVARIEELAAGAVIRSGKCEAPHAPAPHRSASGA